MMRVRSKARKRQRNKHAVVVFATGIAILVLFVVLSNDSKQKQQKTQQTDPLVLRQRANLARTSIVGVSPSPFPTPLAQHIPIQDCHDLQPQCPDWKQQAQCTSNPEYMLANCPASCFGCVWLRTRPNITVRIASHHGPLDMPSVGLGTAGLGEKTTSTVQAAVQAGYRLLDTAAAREWYRQDLVGQALAALPTHAKHDIWVTSKVHPRDLGFNATLTAVDRILHDLDRPFIHLLLLHYPRCWPELCGGATRQTTGTAATGTAATGTATGEEIQQQQEGWQQQEQQQQEQQQEGWQGSWRAIEFLIRKGHVLAAGVSNFDMHDLLELWDMAHIKPSVVQRFADPLHPDMLVRRWCALVGVQYQAYSSLGTQEMMKGSTVNPVLTQERLRTIAAKKGWSVVQVVLRWALQTGQAVLPRSSNPEHLRDNLKAVMLDDLGEEDLEAIDGMGMSEFL